MKHAFRSLAALLLALTFLLCGCQTVLSETGRPDPITDPLPFTEPDPVCPYPVVPDTPAKGLAVATPVFPKAAQYPSEGNEWDESFRKAYDAWSAERVANRRLNAGAGEAWKTFFREMAVAALKDGLESPVPEIAQIWESENHLVSPVNLAMALSMLAEITGGESRAEILSALGADSLEDLRKNAAALWRAAWRDDGLQTSLIQNSLWLNENISFQKETMENLAKLYYAASFAGEPGTEEFDKAMQDWMNEATGHLLEDLIGGIKNDPNLLISLVSCLYFSAPWQDEFAESQTKEADFHSPGGDVKAKFMHRTLSYGPYYWGEKFAAVRLAFNDDGGFWILLPDEGVRPEELLYDEEALSFLFDRGEWKNSTSIRVNLALPKFSANNGSDLRDVLREMGVASIFDPEKADFTPLLETPRNGEVYVSSVDHGAGVTVDEKGVKAAAFTRIAVAGNAEPPQEEVDFTVDRPFLFCIEENGLPLFCGVVNQI